MPVCPFVCLGLLICGVSILQTSCYLQLLYASVSFGGDSCVLLQPASSTSRDILLSDSLLVELIIRDMRRGKAKLPRLREENWLLTGSTSISFTFRKTVLEIELLIGSSDFSSPSHLDSQRSTNGDAIFLLGSGPIDTHVEFESQHCYSRRCDSFVVGTTREQAQLELDAVHAII